MSATSRLNAVTIAAGMPWMRTASVERRRQVLEATRQAHQEAEQRRARVLAHPDLAERLRVALSLSSAAHWNGYVPPADCSGPVRRELIAILHAVIEREQATA